MWSGGARLWRVEMEGKKGTLEKNEGGMWRSAEAVEAGRDPHHRQPVLYRCWKPSLGWLVR